MSRSISSLRCRAAAVGAIASLLVAAAPAFAANDLFLVFGNPSSGGAHFTITGETTDREFSPQNAFEISDFSFGVENPTTIGSMTGGAGAGKAKFSTFTFKSQVDTATPVLFEACGAGVHYDHVTLYVRKAGGPGRTGAVVDQFTLATVFVQKITISDSSGDDRPTETVELQFGGVKLSHNGQAGTGAGGKTVEGQWNQITNSPDVNVAVK